eukprot:TRINITY_DN19283_c0_g1_i3.p2 TRINITY_DN19283_c0_g1~~TRINITY_DN19283_c0_g1_i3.p2  ORF type:complete len:112 (-),score=18.16 TRINITY_DN19283_c0_g1_i3:51-386(-)
MRNEEHIDPNSQDIAPTLQNHMYSKRLDPSKSQIVPGERVLRINRHRLLIALVLAVQLAGDRASSSPAQACLLYTSDAADEEDSVDLGGRRIIKKKKKIKNYNEYYNIDKK